MLRASVGVPVAKKATSPDGMILNRHRSRIQAGMPGLSDLLPLSTGLDLRVGPCGWLLETVKFVL
ncbi:hypothetical protein D3C81_1439000 [compost metagenome]